MKHISILGCGWLGMPLAKALTANKFLVKGSTTSADKLSDLINAGINSFLIALESKSILGNIEDFLNGSEILIIDIPPKLRSNPESDFVGKIKTLIPFIEKSTVEKVLFISSTAVYEDSNLIITEATIPKPQTESGKQMLETELLLQSNHHFKTTTLRFGGLIGNERHPIKQLSGKTNLSNPNAPVNLIHLEDCVGIILNLINHKKPEEVWNQTFNAVTPFHPSRKEYYTKKAIEIKMLLPEFADDSANSGKIISSTKIQTVLNYSFIIPSL